MSSQAKPATPQAKSDAARKAIRRIAVGPERGVAEMAGLAVRAILALAAVGFIVHGFGLEPDSAVHQIYQLNAISTGLVLIGVVGVWGAVDALRREPK